MVLRLSEIYTSVQGEGPKTGLPTTFVRFGGCNLRCPGWPCDTQHAIDPKFYKDWTKYSPVELVALVPEWPKNICITGGEPLLQDRESLDKFIQLLLNRKATIEIFTNGTQPIGGFIGTYSGVQLDWKLTGSGHGDRDIDQRIWNIKILTQAPWPHYHGIKFVIKDEDDFVEAYHWWEYLMEKCPNNLQFWAGVVWGQKYTDEQLVHDILDLQVPWRLNVQQHKHIWHPDKRAV